VQETLLTRNITHTQNIYIYTTEGEIISTCEIKKKKKKKKKKKRKVEGFHLSG
jgi:hypothetical protein